VGICSFNVEPSGVISLVVSAVVICEFFRQVHCTVLMLFRVQI
jgi:hypothetical protein